MEVRKSRVLHAGRHKQRQFPDNQGSVFCTNVTLKILSSFNEFYAEIFRFKRAMCFVSHVFVYVACKARTQDLSAVIVSIHIVTKITMWFNSCAAERLRSIPWFQQLLDLNLPFELLYVSSANAEVADEMEFLVLLLWAWIWNFIPHLIFIAVRV